MNILYFTQLFYPAVYGGGEYAFYLWAREFAKRGHKVKVITQRLKGLPEYEKIDGIEVYRTGNSVEYQGKLNLNILNNLSYIAGATRLGIKFGRWSDIMHANTYIPVISGSIAHTIKRKPLIASVHDVYLLGRKEFWKKWSSQKGVSKANTFLGPITEKLVLKLPKTLNQTGSDASVQDLIDVGIKEKDIVKIPYAIDVSDFSRRKMKEERYMFYVGRLVFYKNVDVVIRALKLLSKKHPDLKLIIAGDGPHREYLENLAMDLGIADNVIFKGRVSHKEKVKLFKKSLFMVQPSIVEGFGITIIEAFACEKPVLAARVPPMTELVKTDITGFTAEPYDADDWAKKIDLLVHNSNLRKSMGKKARKILEENYTIEKVVDKIEDLYKKLNN